MSAPAKCRRDHTHRVPTGPPVDAQQRARALVDELLCPRCSAPRDPDPCGCPPDPPT